MQRDCALELKGLRSSSGAAPVHFDSLAAKIRPQYGGRLPQQGTLKRFLASRLVNHGVYIVLALQHTGNKKSANISWGHGASLHVAMNFCPLRCHGPAAVHNLLKLEEVKHCYDECIGGISMGAPLVSAPDSDACSQSRSAGDIGRRGFAQGSSTGRGWRA